MFVAEVRFYREIAPVVGVRVPACLLAEVNVNRPGFDAASFLAKDACHAEEVPD